MIGTARCLATHFPGDTILIEAKDPKLARKLAPDLKFTPRVRGTRSRARFTILGGGGQFFWFPRDQAAPRFRRLVKTGNAMPPTTVTDYIGAPLSRAFGPSGHRKFAFCIGVGPFDGNPTREAMIATKLKTFSYISVRDARSAAYFRQWGLPAPPIFTDPIFLADHWLPAAETSGGRERDGSILFVPRAWPYRTIGATHFKAMLEAATQLSSAGWRVKFAVFDRVADAPLLSLIASRYEVVTWDPRRWELPAFIEELAHSGVIVSARAHGIYLAALLGIPSVAVVIEPKLDIVQATFARSSAAWDHPFHVGQLLSLVADVSTRNRTDAFYDTALHRARAIDAEKDLVRHIHAQLP